MPNLTPAELKNGLTSIAQEANEPGAYRGKLALDFANYYNKVVKQYPSSVAEIKAVLDEVAGEYKYQYSLEGDIIATGEFTGSAPVKQAPPPPPPPQQQLAPSLQQATEVINQELPPDVKVIRFAEQMPLYPGCESTPEGQARNKCTGDRMQEFIQANVQKPQEAINARVRGKVMVDFVVDLDGYLKNIEVAETLGYGCDEEAVRVVSLMNYLDRRWIPGNQGGEDVRVRITIPVRFN